MFYEISRQVLKSFDSDQRHLAATKVSPLTSIADKLYRRSDCNLTSVRSEIQYPRPINIGVNVTFVTCKRYFLFASMKG